MTVRVGADDFNDIPAGAAELDPGVRIVSFTDFISEAEDTPEPLLGTKQDTILPQDGMVLMYGDGGAGKTTLTIDAACHIGAGIPWLGLEVARPARVTLIENEGPRGKFRQLLSEKSAAWNGNGDFSGNVHVLEDPWTRFTLSAPEHRLALATHISQNEVDVIVMGPLATLGMVGGGTPDEISAFELLMRETRALTRHPFAFWIVHHENKQGDVSGAWERVPDTLIHVQATGNGHTRLVWRKARWSSELHGKSVDLLWGEGRSFQVVDKPERDPWAEMEAAFRHADAWRTAAEAGKLIKLSEEQSKKVLAELVRRGVMVHEKGPSGRSPRALCWRLAENAPTPLADSAEFSGVASDSGETRQLRYSATPVRGAEVAAELSSPDGIDSAGLEESSGVGGFDDIPF